MRRGEAGAIAECLRYPGHLLPQSTQHSTLRCTPSTCRVTAQEYFARFSGRWAVEAVLNPGSGVVVGCRMVQEQEVMPRGAWAAERAWPCYPMATAGSSTPSAVEQSTRRSCASTPRIHPRPHIVRAVVVGYRCSRPGPSVITLPYLRPRPCTGHRTALAAPHCPMHAPCPAPHASRPALHAPYPCHHRQAFRRSCCGCPAWARRCGPRRCGWRGAWLTTSTRRWIRCDARRCARTYQDS